jgi:predicted HNH restriction endonuclease
MPWGIAYDESLGQLFSFCSRLSNAFGSSINSAFEEPTVPTYSESELIIPALEIVDAHPDGITTANLLKELRRQLRPTGDDLEILANRQDDKFSQKVRNLKSHDTLEKKGFSEFSNNKFKITPKGHKFLVDTQGIEPSLRAQGFSEAQRQSALERSYQGIVVEEGELIASNRKVARRSAILRNAALKHFRDADGSIECKGCEFRAEETYGLDYRGLIEIHHTRPLFMSGLQKADIQRAISHLVPLCPTCHRVVHRKAGTCMSVADLRRLVSSARAPQQKLPEYRAPLPVRPR